MIIFVNNAGNKLPMQNRHYAPKNQNPLSVLSFKPFINCDLHLNMMMFTMAAPLIMHEVCSTLFPESVEFFQLY